MLNQAFYLPRTDVEKEVGLYSLGQRYHIGIQKRGVSSIPLREPHGITPPPLIEKRLRPLVENNV